MIINILFWVSIFAGGLLIILMLLSLIGGLDLDMDLDLGSADADTDSGGGGIGLLKGFLTFISVSSWVIKIILATDRHPGVAVAIGIISGLVALFLLNYLFRLLLKNENNVNWQLEDALFQEGEVYLKIPAESNKNGLVQIKIKGAMREIKARSADKTEIKTGDKIRVVEVDDDHVLVSKEI